MQLKQKFKNYNNYIFLNNYRPLKLLSFRSLKWRKINNFIKNIYQKNLKRTKYRKYNKRLRKRLKKNLFIINPIIILKKFFKIQRNIKKLKFKNSNKKKLFLYFNQFIFFTKKNKSSKSKLKNIQKYLLKFNNNINLLLWYLNFSYSASNIRKKNILFNNSTLKFRYTLSKGLFIHFNDEFNKQINQSYYKYNNNLASTVEIDFYYNAFIILKDNKSTNINDSFLQIGDYFNLSLIAKKK